MSQGLIVIVFVFQKSYRSNGEGMQCVRCASGQERGIRRVSTHPIDEGKSPKIHGRREAIDKYGQTAPPLPAHYSLKRHLVAAKAILFIAPSSSSILTAKGHVLIQRPFRNALATEDIQFWILAARYCVGYYVHCFFVHAGHVGH